MLATAGGNFAVIIDVTGLQPDTRYFFRARIRNTPQARIQSFRTFPIPGETSTFTFGFGSCQQSGSLLPSPTTPGNIYRQVIAVEPRFFLQLGDWGYPDSTDRAPFDSNFFAADYEKVQATYLSRFRSDYLMDTLLAATPVDYVYDDHDYMNDNASARTSSFAVPFRPNPLGPDFVTLELTNPAGARENSIRAYRENMPTYPLVNESRGIYHKFTCGNVDVFALDLRSQRSPNLEGFFRHPVMNRWVNEPPPDHSILGREGAPGSGTGQFAWLLEELRNSTATWKFLMSSVPFNRAQSVAIILGLLLQDSVITDVPQLPAGTTGIFAAFEFADKWAGYRSDADSLLSFIEENGITNVIVLSGDSHTAAIDDGANAGLPEIMAGGLDITNSRIVSIMNKFGLNLWNRGGQGVSTPDFNNAFGRVTVFGEDSVELAVVDEFGTVVAAHSVRNATTGIVERYGGPLTASLEQNYPNPFNPDTRIRFTIDSPRGGTTAGRTQRVSLRVYDVLGREVAALVDQELQPGSYEVEWNARGASSGTYVYRLKAGDTVLARRMALMR
jgi:phosphodiesterase/alkaline phosphatase D-like protein